MLEQNEIYCGDCQTVMQDIYSNSVDCIITDPPYGLSFMGKNWDKAVPSVAIWQECLRVLKPGAFAFVMCIPRQDCLARMICRVEDAGFNIGFSSIYWTYATGFPKAASLSKQADKRAGVPSLAKAFNVAGRGERKDLQNSKRALKYRADYGYKHELKTEQAKALDGVYAGMQLKPAVEIILVAMKPIEEKTYLDQAISNKHGCTWLDDCRIPHNKESLGGGTEKCDSMKGKEGWDRPWRHNKEKEMEYCERIKNNVKKSETKGRFPANVLCEDAVLDDGIERKSGAILTHHKRSGNSNLGKTFKIRDRTGEYADWKSNSGEYSRFFSLDAWFAERIKLLPKESQKTFPWLIAHKASKSEKNRGCEEFKGTMHFPSNKESGNMLSSGGNKPRRIKGNSHPTCKPIKLMSWLTTLASREGDIVLDPFCGSGTTAIAAKMLGRQYIGIEKEEEYCEIARKRLLAIPPRLDTY